MPSTNTVEGIMPQESYNYHLLESEDPLLQDPLTTAKPEIGENEPSPSIIMLIDSRETIADAHIPNEAMEANQDDLSGGEEETLSDGNIIVHSGERVNNDDNLNGTLKDKYTCNICDDICADGLELDQHLEFHLELYNNDTNTIANTEIVTVDKNISLSKTAVSIADSSQTAQSPTTFAQALTNKSKDNDVVEGTVIDESSCSENSQSTQANEDIFNCNLSSTHVALTKIVPIATSSSSIPLGVGYSTNVDAIEAIAADISSSSPPCNSSGIIEETINSHLLPSIDVDTYKAAAKIDVIDKSSSAESSDSSASCYSPSSESSNSSDSEEESLNSKLLPNEVTATKAVSSPQHGKDTSASKFETAKKVNKAPVNYKLPMIPIRKCDCRLKQLSTECEFCAEPAIYVCGNCKKECKSFTELKEHFLDAHKSARYFCQECGRGYTRRRFWQNHTDRHKGLLSCYQCTSSFKTKQELEEHTVTHRSKCSKCDKICSSIPNLKVHMLEVHKGITYTCKECKKTFDKYHNLKSHNDRHHRIGEYTCNTCGKKFTKLAAYQGHSFIHKQAAKVICDECGKEYSSVKAFKYHQKRMHTQADSEKAESKKVYTCDVCKKEFYTANAKRHCEDKHAGTPRYKCDMCENAYFYPGSLIVHKRIHTGEKPYLCFICDRRFYAHQILLKHCLSHGIPEKDLRKKLKSSYRSEK